MNIANSESIEDILYYHYGYNWDGVTPFNTSQSICMVLTLWHMSMRWLETMIQQQFNGELQTLQHKK